MTAPYAIREELFYTEKLRNGDEVSWNQYLDEMSVERRNEVFEHSLKPCDANWCFLCAIRERVLEQIGK
jgi:hypothetical protein